jgi:cytochrome c5
VGSLLLAAQANAASGKEVYDVTCVACHGAGALGVPKIGDKAAWAPRVATGASTLHASALKGKGVMPPKGGNAGPSDANVTAAVDFMVNQAK